jgi:urease subunit gamma/beta
MRLQPRELDRLLIFQAAELARRRRARGLRLNQAEAIALIADEVIEAARDGASYEDAERAGYELLGPSDVMDEVAELVGLVEVEALFGDGTRLVTLIDPIAAEGKMEPSDAESSPSWIADDHRLTITNHGDVTVALTSHLHVFEANRALRFDRAAAWGMRLAIEAGDKVVLRAGDTVEVRLVPIGGGRIVRGHGGLVDGELDAPGAKERGLQAARDRGYLGA